MKKLSIVVLLSFLCLYGVAQTAIPCLPTWGYRVPITLDNTANPDALTQHQVLLEVNTQTLVSAGKMKADGGDIRFKNAAGVFLSHWIENETMNTTNTKIWVKVDNMPMLSTIDVFMFYGQANANNTADGTATFVHYDNFDGNALDFNKWTYCGGAAGGTIPVVSNGEVTLGSSSGFSGQSIS